jgi:hypothetical protein
MIDAEACGTSIKSLSPKHSTKSTIVLTADLIHNSVHRPAIQFVVRENLEWEGVLLLIALDGLETAM